MPEDPYIAYYAGVIAYNNAEFERARDMALLNRDDLHPAVQYGHQITYAASSFFTGDYDQTIAVLSPIHENADRPTVYTLAFLAAAYQAIGNSVAARAFVAELRDTYPQLKPRFLIGSFANQPEIVTPFIDAFSAAGWNLDEEP